MKKFLKALQKIENAIVLVSFTVMLLSAFAQVVNRNIVGAAVSWFEELARYNMVFMALLATEIGLRDGSQISIDAVANLFRGIPRKLLDVFAKLVVVLFSGIVFYSSLSILEKQISFGQFSPGLMLPMYIPYFALPLSFGIITCVQLAALAAVIAAPAESGELKGEGA